MAGVAPPPPGRPLLPIGPGLLEGQLDLEVEIPQDPSRKRSRSCFWVLFDGGGSTQLGRSGFRVTGSLHDYPPRSQLATISCHSRRQIP
jgi:hypothetical protein